MSKTTILLVHGIGSHTPENMKKAFSTAVNMTAKKHFKLEYDITKDQTVSIKEFNYSVEFDDERKKMSEVAKGGTGNPVGELLKQLTFNGTLDLVSDIITELGRIDGNGFIYENLLDIMLYGSTHCGPRVRSRLKYQINELVKDNGQLVIVAHSMGTAVVHDSLNALYEKHPGINTVNGLITFANVSRMLPLISGLPIPSDGRVHMNTEQGGCIRDLFINSYNWMDPLVHFLPFHKTQTFGVQHIQQTIQKGEHPHDFGQYVAHPEIVAELLNNVCRAPKRIYRADLQEALISYRKGSINAKFDEVKTKLDRLRKDDRNLTDLAKFFKAADGAYKAIEDVVGQLKA